MSNYRFLVDLNQMSSTKTYSPLEKFGVKKKFMLNDVPIFASVKYLSKKCLDWRLFCFLTAATVAIASTTHMFLLRFLLQLIEITMKTF